MRLKSAEEEEMYPDLIQDMDAETKQENVIENPKNTPEKK
jgi:hypothetical protein